MTDSKFIKPTRKKLLTTILIVLLVSVLVYWFGFVVSCPIPGGFRGGSEMDVELDKLANLYCEIGGVRLEAVLLIFAYPLSCTTVAFYESQKTRKPKKK